PDREGLLYAGTEFGMYVSFDNGKRWQPLQLNLPATPVTDLKIHKKDLVLATQGRGFWIMDDLTPLHQLNDVVVGTGNREPGTGTSRGATGPGSQFPVPYLFKPRDAYR